MGSLGAMKARGFSKDRYFQGDVEDVAKLVPEGIEGRVRVQGAARTDRPPARRRPPRRQWATAARRPSRSCKEARFVRITGAGLRESHPHDVTITKDAPNYRRG